MGTNAIPLLGRLLVRRGGVGLCAYDFIAARVLGISLRVLSMSGSGSVLLFHVSCWEVLKMMSPVLCDSLCHFGSHIELRNT